MAGRWGETVDVDFAAGAVGIVRNEAFERGRGGEPVEQTARDTPVQGADSGFVLAYRGAVGAVAQPAAQPPFRLTLDLGLEAEPG